MYKLGDLKMIEPPCDKMEGEGYCLEYSDNYEPHVHMLNDARHGLNWKTPTVYLPHSCQEWIIGGSAEILAMINDLQEALKSIKGESNGQG